MAAADLTELVGQDARLEAVHAELAELLGQRNAIDAEIVGLVRRVEDEQLLGATGCRSLKHWVMWKTGSSSAHAAALVSVATRAEEFPRCIDGLASGALSLDQVAAISELAAPGSDDHYAELAASATVSQLRTALRMAPRPKAEPPVVPERSITKTTDERHSYYRVKMPHAEAAGFDAALQSHHDALVAEWQRDHGERDAAGGEAPPFPTRYDAFVRLYEHGWDADVAARPHGQRTTTIVHVDVRSRIGWLHRGPAMSEAERRYLTCDSLVETWFERDGVPIGCGRETRQIPRRLRRALEHRHPTCAVPGCGATRGLHAHHIRHWEDGGPTELWNLVLLCPFHHRSHHLGTITVRGPGAAVTVTDATGQVRTGGSVARPPTTSPPAVPPYDGPTGERADWYWYQPIEPAPSDN